MPVHRKNENSYFLVPAQIKRMHTILVSCEGPYRSNLQKTTALVQWGHDPHCFFAISSLTVLQMTLGLVALHSIYLQWELKHINFQWDH